MREKQLVHERQRENSPKEFSGLTLNCPVLECPIDPELNDRVKFAELFGATAKAPLRLCPAASECEETLVRANIGFDVRPGM